MRPGIAEFILARVAEDEERAREALKPSDIDVFMDEKRSFYATVGAHRDDWGLYTFNVPVERVLDECEAKRRIVELHQVITVWPDGTGGAKYYTGRKLVCSSCEDGPTAEVPCRTLIALAAIWADHPDYREEWR